MHGGREQCRRADEPGEPPGSSITIRLKLPGEMLDGLVQLAVCMGSPIWDPQYGIHPIVKWMHRSLPRPIPTVFTCPSVG